MHSTGYQHTPGGQFRKSIKYFRPKLFQPKRTRLMHLLSFASLFPAEQIRKGTEGSLPRCQKNQNVREAPLRKMQGLFRHCPNGEGGGLDPCPNGLGHLF